VYEPVHRIPEPQVRHRLFCSDFQSLEIRIDRVADFTVFY